MALHEPHDHLICHLFCIALGDREVTTIHETRLAQPVRNVGAGAPKHPEVIK